MNSEILVITAARNEALNLPEMRHRLSAALDAHAMAWRWLIVDDASDDDTFAVAALLAEGDSRIAAVRFSLHGGSHRAVFSGLRIAAADPRVAAAAILAADLEDPPEALPCLIELWRTGAKIVFARRSGRPGVRVWRRWAAIACHGFVCLVLGSRSYPWTGADMVLIDRTAIAAIAADDRPIGNIYVRVARLGLPTAIASVVKGSRSRGSSQWSNAALGRLAAATLGEALGVASGPSCPPVAAAVGWARNQ
jgi:glycosyltransferase involved in cell wall biosynthesis